MVKAVILAAGRGERLLPLTQNAPKPLLRVQNKPLLEHTINTLKQGGVNLYIVATGYMSQAIQDFLGDGSKFDVEVRYSYNAAYDDGNATSLRTTRRFLEGNEPFLLVMSDHLIDEAMVKKALENLDRAPLLCVDRKPTYPIRVEDSTKVLVDSDGFIRDIGKEIPSWNAIDTGVFLLNDKIFEVIEQIEAEGTVTPLTLNHCMRQMIANGNPLWACEVSGSLWLDVDTLEDLILAERLFGGSPSV